MTQGDNLAKRFMVIPLVVAQNPPFGALQLEAARPLDKTDLIFVNAVANQLAIALDRDRAWRRDITRRELAEERQAHAEAKEAAAERERVAAESSKEKYETLAAANGRLYEQAQKAVYAREQVLAIVSHDLRTPLGAILMTAAGLTKTAAAADASGLLPRTVGRIQRSAQQMLRLIEDLLDFASIEAGSLAIKRRPDAPGSLIAETLTSFESAANKRRLAAEVAPQLPNIYCDRDRVLQVLSNLVANATKVTADGGHITLRVGARGDEVFFAVSDDGPGISPEDSKHLFERYWRSDEAHYKGTGLGLAIARGIVDAHGGRIWVESELGQGATFLFTIPTADETSLFMQNDQGDHADGTH